MVASLPVDAFDQTMDYSTQIFSLGVLLSSLLVFNQVGRVRAVHLLIHSLILEPAVSSNFSNEW